MDVQSFTDVYQKLDKFSLDLLAVIYHPNIVFEDPVHRIHGLVPLRCYFEHLFDNVTECHFDIKDKFQQQNVGFITWKMVFRHTRMNQDRPIEVNGVSHIRFKDGLVIFHRDYFDLGAMLYEHIPLLGFAIRKLKQRLSQ